MRAAGLADKMAPFDAARVALRAFERESTSVASG